MLLYGGRGSSVPPHVLLASANKSIGSQPGDTPRCGPETPEMAASPSTTTSIPPVSFKTPSTTERKPNSQTPWPESDVLVCCSCRLTLIVFQQAAQPLPTPHLFLFSTDCVSWQRE